MKYAYMFNKNFKTERRFKTLAILDKDVYNHRIDLDRVDFNSFKFLNIEEDIHILVCWRNFNTSSLNFLIEHESYPQVPIGAETEVYNAKIVSCIRLIKLSKHL